MFLFALPADELSLVTLSIHAPLYVLGLDTAIPRLEELKRIIIKFNGFNESAAAATRTMDTVHGHRIDQKYELLIFSIIKLFSNKKILIPASSASPEIHFEVHKLYVL